MISIFKDAIASTKSLYSGIKTLAELDERIVTKAELNALLNLASDTNFKIIEIQTLYTAMAGEKDLIAQENLKLKDWQVDKVRYELCALAQNALAYSVKPEHASVEPLHYLCASCYQNNIKSILQADGYAGFERKLSCHSCKSSVLYRDNADDFSAQTTEGRGGWRRDF